jgi:hypothetical protein
MSAMMRFVKDRLLFNLAYSCILYELHRAAELPGRGRPPEAAARRAGLEVVEKLLTAIRA